MCIIDSHGRSITLCIIDSHGKSKRKVRMLCFIPINSVILSLCVFGSIVTVYNTQSHRIKRLVAAGFGTPVRVVAKVTS